MLKIKFMVLKFTHRRRCRGEYLLKFHPAINQLLAAVAAINSQGIQHSRWGALAGNPSGEEFQSELQRCARDDH